MKSGYQFLLRKAALLALIQNTNGTEHARYLCLQHPIEEWRWAEVTEQRTKIDWLRQIEELVTVDFPHVQKIVLVMDNLNTHTIGVLYKAFPPEKARQLREKLEIHYTPKNGRWLNMAKL